MGLEHPREVRTDRNGRYQFTHLPPGKYSLMVDLPEFRATHLRQSFGDPNPLDPSRAPKRFFVQVKEAEVRDGVNFSLWRALAISGRVVDEYGEPLANIDVAAQTAGRRSGNMYGSRTSDDRGAFRLFGLGPGQYRVCALPRNYALRDEEIRERPVRTCYPSAVIDSEAQIVPLTTSEVGDIEIRVQRSRAFTVSGIVLDASGVPAEHANVGLVHDEGSNMYSSSVDTRPGGQFLATGVTPGEYTIRAETGPPSLNASDTRDRQAGMLPIRVETSDLEGLVVVLAKPVKIAGHVLFEEGAPAARRNTPINVSVRFDPRAMRMMSGPPPTAQVKEDLTFELSGLVGLQTLGVTGIPPDWMLKAIRYNGADITDLPADFKASADPRALEIVLSSRGAILSGRTVDAGGNAVGGSRVIMFSVDPARWRMTVTTTSFGTSRDDGTFRFPPRRAGEYFVLALEPDETFPDLEERSSFELLAKVAERVTLVENDQRVMDLHAVKLPDQ
jgi:hypothetical protein